MVMMVLMTWFGDYILVHGDDDIDDMVTIWFMVMLVLMAWFGDYMLVHGDDGIDDMVW